ncbi:sulfatase-like hydrolase/transferase [Methanolobus profundi]|uniref:Phosphoglycerate mutase (BPG-independent, AlkP superfamily) n=1 Tax=Methanolobus profundi TaxID=487685 RepID=A0A1I4PRB3_9EURY|nr:sulfatase-like hydrolase/transferase [Methanolobus profundi]SFM29935.1 Phosphoglycerate mutase (BPG-independent, AlkP superfamily) [Methanolobus profundi]
MTAGKNGMKHKYLGNGRYNTYKHAVFQLSILCFLFFVLISVCSANEVAEFDQVNTPQGAVILIVDGLSSCYIYPEYTPYAIDGSVLDKAEPEQILQIFDQSCRVLDITAPQTFTEGGHSVLATGYSKADGELVASSGTTVYDVAHDNGYLTFAIMEKGDSSGMRSKQNVIVHDAENSITEPEMIIETNMLSGDGKSISLEIADLMQENSIELQDQLDQYPDGSQEKYDAYDIWAIDTAIELMDHMEREYPEQHYILTINVGAVDCAGHYKKNSGYIATIKGIDNATMDLYETCIENDMAFIFTGDHGMSFATADSRGGHQADKYSIMTESQKVPLVIAAKDVNTGTIEGQFGQEDIAPTILEVLNLPGKLRAADGTAIPVKDYVSLKVQVPGEGQLTLIQNEDIIFESKINDAISFVGLEPDMDYKLKYNPISDAEKDIEKVINIGSSTIIELVTSSNQSTSDKSYHNPRYIIGGTLIVCVNLAGLALIRKVLKE